MSILGTFVIVALLVAGILRIQQAHAQVDASSSDIVSATTQDAEVAPQPTSTDATDDTSGAVLGVSTSSDASATPPTIDNTATVPADGATTAPTDSGSSTAAVASDSNSTTVATEPPPPGLTEVHIIGTKYIDYFTDGTTTVSFPGDPQIDANFDKPDAPIPTHEGLTWVHTTGQYLYDTPSGDLEEGEYALLPSGHYISNGFPFVSSNSTPATASSSETQSGPTVSPEVLGASTSSQETPSHTSSTPTTEPVPVDTITPTTTAPDSTTAPVTHDSASDSSQAPAAATTTDTPSI
jgi:hypothetical protein